MTTNGSNITYVDVNETVIGCAIETPQDPAVVPCVTDTMFGAGPPMVIGLMFGGVLLSSLYIAGNGEVVVPAIVTILLGSVLVPLLPAQFAAAAYGVAIVGITAAGMVILRRYVLEGGF